MSSPAAMVPDTSTIAQWESKLNGILSGVSASAASAASAAKDQAADISVKAQIVPENMVSHVIKQINEKGTDWATVAVVIAAAGIGLYALRGNR
jgi:hypothetical protein